MPSLGTLAVFIPAALAVLVIPGPAVTYIVTRSVHQGRRAGLISVAGLTTGLLVQVAAAVTGLSALLLSSAIAFRAVKLAGAAYLIYLGVRTFVKRPAGKAAGGSAARSARRMYLEGLLINSLNPKPALFFAAFLPQFVDASRGPATLQLLVLGLLFCALALVSDGAYAVLAGTISRRLQARRDRRETTRYVAAGTYLGLGVLAAVTGDRKG